MATTARDIVTRALRRIGVTDASEDPQAHEAKIALDALNGMMFGWESMGVDVEHTEYSLTTDIALDAKYHLALEYLLAEQIAAPSFGQLTRADLNKAASGWRMIYAGFATNAEVTLPRSITYLPSEADALWAVESSSTA